MEQPNNKYIDELSGEDKDFRIKMIAILKQELPEEIEAYNQLIEANEFKEAALMVHKLKHKISILGLEKSYYLAEEYEKYLKKDKVNLQDDFEAVLQDMLEFVVELK